MGQETILKLRSALGYAGLDIFSSSKEGICRGVAQTAINAFILEKALEKEAREKGDTHERQNEFQRYLDRIDFILTHHNHLARLIFDTYRAIKERKSQANSVNSELEIDKDEQKILDVAAIVEAMQLFAYPDKYSDVFGKHLTQQDIVEISYYAQPVELEKRSIPIQQRDNDIQSENENLDEIKKQSGIIKIGGISGIYTPDELTNYIALLTNFVEKKPCDLALAIDNDEHAISIFYDTSTKNWTMIDAEHLSIRAVSPEELAQRISRELPDIFDPIKVFNMKFFTSVNRKKEVEKFVTELKCQEGFIKLHNVTAERAQLADQRGVTLAYIAACEGDVPVLISLAKLVNTNNEPLIDFNKPIKDGTTPLSMSIQNGCADAVKLIADLRKQDGTPYIDFNKPIKTIRGTWTPLYLAAQYDQGNVIQVLSDFKKSDGTFLIDFNQAVEGLSPAFAAAQYGCANAFRTLVELRNLDCTRVVDVKKPVFFGSTCLHIALLRGHTNIVKILAEMKNPDGSNVVNLNDTIQDGRAAIHIAINEKNLSMLKMLIELKNSDGLVLIDFNKKDREGYSIIHQAAQKGYTDIMEFFLSTRNITGIDINALNKGLSIAHIAAANNHLNILKILEKNGIDIEIQIADKKPIDLATHSDVFNFYRAIDKRKKLIADLEQMKDIRISSLEFENIKTNIFESFYNDHEKFLQSKEFENIFESFRNPSYQSQNVHAFFYADDGHKINEQTEENKLNYVFEMETEIREDFIELKFKSSRLIKLDKVSSDPVIWELSIEDDFGKKLNIAINNKILIEKLKTTLSQRDLQACVDILKEQKGRTYRKIGKQIENEIDMQKYEQDNRPQVSQK